MDNDSTEETGVELNGTPAKKKSKNSGSKKAAKKSRKKSGKKTGNASAGSSANYPRHTVEKALRIPKAILEQNAGKECSEADSAKYCGVGYNGPYRLEVSSALKYGLLERTGPSQIRPTELAKKIIKPKSSE